MLHQISHQSDIDHSVSKDQDRHFFLFPSSLWPEKVHSVFSVQSDQFQCGSHLSASSLQVLSIKFFLFQRLECVVTTLQNVTGRLHAFLQTFCLLFVNSYRQTLLFIYLINTNIYH